MRPGWHNRGYLPHCDSEQLVQHVVFRLADSLPHDVAEALRLLSKDAARKRVDAALDLGSGQALLRTPENAAIVAQAIQTFAGERYHLYAWCIMPNHVHAVIGPVGVHKLGAIVKSWKAYTSAKINQRLGRAGPLWAPDYFDRYMRDDDHLSATIAYVESNPVKAGLCGSPDSWPYSSATGQPHSSASEDARS